MATPPTGLEGRRGGHRDRDAAHFVASHDLSSGPGSGSSSHPLPAPPVFVESILPFDALPLASSSVYLCPVCGMQFDHRATFRRHYMIHSGEKPYACALCPYRARQKGTLNQHVRFKHSNLEVVASASDGPPKSRSQATSDRL